MEKFTGGIEAYDSSVSVTSQNAVLTVQAALSTVA